MPRGNRFRHQVYTAEPPTTPCELLQPRGVPPPGSDEFIDRMRAVGDVFRAQGVAAIYLVHGTFAGCDALGILSELERSLPLLGGTAVMSAWRKTAKQMVDAVFGGVGNYTAAYAQTLEQAIHRPGVRQIPVRRFSWSGENHHIGRADAAVRLIDELAAVEMRNSECGIRNEGSQTNAADNSAGGISQSESPHNYTLPGHSASPRILLWGHSHAGNVFALASNLLSGDADAVEVFFAASAAYYRRRLLGRGELPHWQRARELLTSGTPSNHAGTMRKREGGGDSLGRRVGASAFALDFVTFGTPIRYGWDAGGYGRLLHFVNHRPTDWLPPHRAPFPPCEPDVRTAKDGDYIQQLAIAGTNFPPTLLSWRAVLADLRLGRLLQEGLRKRDLLDRLLNGMRVPNEGTTLLVDYGPPQNGAGPQNIVQHLAGHAVYTRPEWMLFHAEEAARRLYGETANPPLAAPP